MLTVRPRVWAMGVANVIAAARRAAVGASVGVRRVGDREQGEARVQIGAARAERLPRRDQGGG